jgi:hypothetical protein
MGASTASSGNGGSIPADGTVASAKATSGELQDKGSGKLADAVETVRGKSGNLQAGLANLLETSAKTIRQRGTSVSQAAGTTIGDGAAERLVRSGEATAAVLERSAMWLRENDLSDVEARLTHQIEYHPKRTLLLAAGLGFLLSRRR